MSCLEVLGEAAASKKNQSNRGLGKAGLTGPRILYLQDALCFIFYFFENSQDLWVQIPELHSEKAKGSFGLKNPQGVFSQAYPLEPVTVVRGSR